MLLRKRYIGIRLPKRKHKNLLICKNLLLVATAPISAPVIQQQGVPQQLGPERQLRKSDPKS